DRRVPWRAGRTSSGDRRRSAGHRIVRGDAGPDVRDGALPQRRPSRAADGAAGRRRHAGESPRSAPRAGEPVAFRRALATMMKTTIGQTTFTLQATERDGQWLARAARD